jgi:hypothetical protein
MKFKLYLVWLWLCNQVNRLVAWFEKDIPKPGGHLPSLTDTQFLEKVGYGKCMEDIHSYMRSTPTQNEQLVLIKLIEHLNRKGGSYGTK